MKLRTITLALAALTTAGAFGQNASPVVQKAIANANKAVNAIVATPKAKRSFANTLSAIDDLSVRLETDTNMQLFMQYVHPDPKVREQSRMDEEILSSWYIDLSKREDLYNAVKSYASTNPKLDGERKRYLDFTLRDYRRAGMNLPKAKRDQLVEIEKEISKLGIEFSTNIAEDPLKVPLLVSELKGVPAQVYANLPQVAGVVMIGLDGPTYGAIMDYCEIPATRLKMQWQYRRRGGSKNVEILEKLLVLRNQQASLLGFKNTVDYEVEIRMAKNSQTVAKFYDDLRQVVRQKAQQDYELFSKAKQEETGDTSAKLEPWDYSYYKRRLMSSKYAVDSQKVAEYFSMDNAFKGLFEITSRLYGITYKDITADASKLGFPVWHPDVKFYEVSDTKSGKVLGRIFTDLHPRENKYSHAACWGLRPRKVWSDGTIQVPLAALVCNFTKPTADKPSLMTHDEVETFFHEFGHGLHQILTATQMGRFSGTAVARDFVEAPSQMMENWVWDPEVLGLFAKHYKTGETIPGEMLNGMKAARTLGSGIETEGQFFLGQMDHKFHTAPGGKVDTMKVVAETYNSCTLYKSLPGNMAHANFGHLVGYQGAYYGYLWSLVYAQDMYQRFEELGVLSPEAGMYYRNKVLGRGGSMDEMAMLRDYLGREPKLDAFMRHLGLGN